jgi:hypothetical protein
MRRDVYLWTYSYETETSLVGQNQMAFDEILREIVRYKSHKQLHLLEGSDILTDFSALSCDLVHPSDYGHALMGENFSRMIRVQLEL